MPEEQIRGNCTSCQYHIFNCIGVGAIVTLRRNDISESVLVVVAARLRIVHVHFSVVTGVAKNLVS